MWVAGHQFQLQELALAPAPESWCWLSTHVWSRTCGLEGSLVSSVQQMCQLPSIAAREFKDLTVEVLPQARSYMSTLGIGSRQ